jgi:hypothetical protein
MIFGGFFSWSADKYLLWSFGDVCVMVLDAYKRGRATFTENPDLSITSKMFRLALLFLTKNLQLDITRSHDQLLYAHAVRKSWARD